MNVCILNHGIRWVRGRVSYSDEVWELSDANAPYGAAARVVYVGPCVGYALYYAFIENYSLQRLEKMFPTLDAAMGHFAGLLAIRKLKE